ncbi:ATP-binding cassette domain-containing protein [Actinomyces ruminicola]|uniref:FHA modulated ABC efflux pump with fused ATPase and integral membrane subunits n=1 Tax=Actinomyces ruminicola TaxID=332524 RepID=A0A1G9ZH19_9ACTO|nr:ATP-binding cassette domain-containing protein [Actinomyces ruminicola]SDN19876.1 FHA modulated ABC efflux pump with fused ATPase and integral membrane subunits [Actinomyces ruminicola]
MPTTALAVRLTNAPAYEQPRVFTAAFTVGRRPTCDVVVSTSNVVSGEHLRVTPTPEGWVIECISRTNGMVVAGQDTRRALITGPTRVYLANSSGPGIDFMPTTPTASAPASASGAAPTPMPASASGAAPAAPASKTQQYAPVAYGYQTPAPAPVGYGIAAGSAASATATGAAPASSAATVAGPPTPPGPPRSVGSAGTGDFPAGRRRTVAKVTITSSGTIGRAPDASLRLDDPRVSGHHARVDLTPQGIVVTDLRSTNGVFVGQQRVQSYTVTEPTTFGMGSTFVVISPDGTCEVQVATAAGELVGRDLTFSVNDGKLTLLDGVSFALPGNELLAVVGPSGAGKSTLLKALTGEQKAQRGQVLFDGLDVYEHYPVMRNKIGVVPQNDVVHSALTVRQTLEYAAELRFAKDVTKAERRARISEVLEDLDLSEHVDKKVKQLSGGQRKRVSTAIELLTRPSLLFLDEPTSGLDPQLDRDVMDLLASLAHGTRPGDAGRTVVVVTHNENHIDRADKVLILAAGGTPVYFGAPREVIGYFRGRLAEFGRAGRLVVNPPRGGFPDPVSIDGFADVYALIRNHAAELRAHLEATVPSTRRGDGRRLTTSADAAARQAPQQTALRQVSTLVRRHLRIIAADPSYLLFMLALPAIIGLLTKAITGADGFAVPDLPEPTAEQPCVNYSMQALELLVILITGAAFSGMAATVRELVGERDVYLREKAVGLRAGSYLAAKALVLALIVTVQTAIMVGIALALNQAPTDAVLLGAPGLELAACCWAVAFVSGLLGLAVSAFVSSSEQVMPVLVVTIMAQLVLAGGVIPIAGRAVFEQLAWFVPARWGYAMAASTVQMNEILPGRAEDLWEHTISQWGVDLAALSAIGLVCLLACYIGLARRDRR